MEQRLLIIRGAIGILDHERGARSHPVDEVHAQRFGIERTRFRKRLPHAREMRLAARLRPDQQLDMVRPLRPRIDQLDRGAIAIAYEEVFGAKRRAMREIERELVERHEALAWEGCGSSRLAVFRWRGGSGWGAGS